MNMPDSPFPDPNQELAEYQADVAAYGTLKANWWRLLAPRAVFVRRLQCKLVCRLCRSLADSRTASPSMMVSLADLAHWMDCDRLITINEFVRACRMQERVRRGDD